jgi:hypothetical protein
MLLADRSGRKAVLSTRAGLETSDLAHSPGAQQPQNPVTGESLTDPQPHERMLATAIAVPDHFR